MITAADPIDAEELTFIAQTAKRHWGYPEDIMAQWIEQLSITPEIIGTLIVRKASSLTNIVGFHGLRAGGGSIAWLEHLWVRPEYMGQGWGRILFRDAERTAVHSGALVVQITSDPHAEAFYHRMGAKTIGSVSAPLKGATDRVLPLMEKHEVALV